MYSQKEIELAEKYLSGEYSDNQFNYWICLNNLDKNKMIKLVEYLRNFGPMILAAKLIIGFMIVHFVACLIYSIIVHYK